MSDVYSNVFVRFIRQLKEHELIKDNGEHTFQLWQFPEVKDLLQEADISPDLFKVPEYIYVIRALFSADSIVVKNVYGFHPQIKISGTITVNPIDLNTTLIKYDLYPINRQEVYDSEILDIALNLIIQTLLDNKETVQNKLAMRGFGQW